MRNVASPLLSHLVTPGPLGPISLTLWKMQLSVEGLLRDMLLHASALILQNSCDKVICSRHETIEWAKYATIFIKYPLRNPLQFPHPVRIRAPRHLHRNPTPSTLASHAHRQPASGLRNPEYCYCFCNLLNQQALKLHLAELFQLASFEIIAIAWLYFKFHTCFCVQFLFADSKPLFELLAISSFCRRNTSCLIWLKMCIHQQAKTKSSIFSNFSSVIARNDTGVDDWSSASARIEFAFTHCWNSRRMGSVTRAHFWAEFPFKS